MRANGIWKRMLDEYEAPEIDPGVDEALEWYGLVLDRHPLNNAARVNAEPLAAGFGAGVAGFGGG